MKLGRTLIVGVGSPHGDDQVGLRVAEQLAQQVGEGVEVRCAATPSELFDWLDGIGQLLICDGCQIEAPPGSVRHWNWPDAELEQQPFSGSHQMNLPTALGLAELLGQLPSRVTIWGVSIGGTQPASALSPAVASAVPSVVEAMIQAIDHA
jgi:hydrogenase maturation protease